MGGRIRTQEEAENFVRDNGEKPLKVSDLPMLMDAVAVAIDSALTKRAETRSSALKRTADEPEHASDAEADLAEARKAMTAAQEHGKASNLPPWMTYTNSQIAMLPPLINGRIARQAKALGERISELDAEVAALKAEVAEMKGKTNFADVYRGIWQPGKHERGAVCTWAGSLWLAQSDTDAKPGAGADWQLVVKRGGAAKEAR